MPQLVSDAPAVEHEKVLLYGPPKTGKTFAAGTAPTDIFILMVGADNEIKTYQGDDFREKYPDRSGHIMYDWVRETTDARGQFKEAHAFDEACDKLDDALELDEQGECPTPSGGFETIVIDNATMLNSVQMNKAIEINYGIKRGSKDKTTLKQLRDEGIIIPGDNDWMSQMSLMTQFVEWLFTLDKHVIFIAHEWRETEYDRSSRQRNVTKVRPLFTGKHREDIPLLFDNVWYMSVEGAGRNRQYYCTTQGNKKILAGTRQGGVLRERIKDLNLTETFEKMKRHAERGG